MYSNKTTYFIFLTVFLAEFSFFFALPLMGKTPGLSASSVAACLAGAVILESLLMLTSTGYLERFSRRTLICTSLLLRSGAFMTIFLSLSLPAWLIFFFLIAVSKSISKPFLREVLAENLSGNQLKKALYTFSLCQNSAVFVAPLLAVAAMKFSFIETVLLALIISGVVMAVTAMQLIYSFPSSKPSTSPVLAGMRSAFQGVVDSKGIQRILLSSFFCFLIMGIFITSTALLDKINPGIGTYSGLFFSVVGITICLWQGVVTKLTALSDRYSSQLILIGGVLSSSYLLGSVYLAITALIAYSVYESVIIPELYFKATHVPSTIPGSVLFSYILIASNAGEAFGSWLTGLAITHMAEHVPIFILITVLCSAIISFLCLKTADRKEVACQ
ncbi:TPA_asm: MFS transporter [Salmonella enterica subsp. houtenae serovar 45:g,z51:-]|uniref:MFS transporter n=1 Tax=Salmonella enterica subsp. houtenae serovar 45:g,z51:- TaxID=1967611 RepID=A0A736RBV9_SALHO|nr:MFS transporter [Salmonella enterica subsp. houtenae str. CFSAN000557]HAE7767786.1 MFS transporter [Salmonella enterica subsp. houtenae serovar 45:g,z51:-]